VLSDGERTNKVPGTTGESLHSPVLVSMTGSGRIVLKTPAASGWLGRSFDDPGRGDSRPLGRRRAFNPATRRARAVLPVGNVE